jgi:hypothetical protein
MKNLPCFTVAMLIFNAHAIPAHAAESIVGHWARSATACQDPEQHLAIRPLSIGGGFSCVFSGVQRKGNTVTWSGHCFSPDGNRRPETGDEQVAMVAKLEGGKLSLSGMGLAAGPLIRCK